MSACSGGPVCPGKGLGEERRRGRQAQAHPAAGKGRKPFWLAQEPWNNVALTLGPGGPLAPPALLTPRTQLRDSCPPRGPKARII